MLAESALAADLDRGTAGDRYQVVLHVEAESLKAESGEDAIDASAGTPPEGDEPPPHVSAETRQVGAGERMAGHAALEDADGLRVSTETARRMACNAGRVVMRHAGDGSVLDVGRKTRTIPPALRRALLARDRQCRFPGCNARRCDAHHVEHWADGGATRLDNLVLLCRRHHRAVHEEGFTMRMGSAGDTAFCWPDGRPFPDAPSAPGWSGPPLAPTDAHLTAADIVIGPDTATPAWHGERLDLGYAIDVLWAPKDHSGADVNGARE